MENSQEGEYNVIFLLIGEQVGFRSMNPIRLVRDFKGESGEIFDAKILAD